MASERIERWDEHHHHWVPLRDRAAWRARLAAWPLDRVASVALLLLLTLAPLERGLFFADARLPFEALIAMLAVVALVDRARRGGGALVGRPLDWAVLACAAGSLLALLAGPAAPGRALEGFFLAVALLLWYWSAAHLLVGPGRIRALTQVVFGSGVLLCLLGALAAAGLLRFPFAVLWGRVLSTLQYPNALAAWIVASAIAACSLMLDLLSRPAGRFGQWALAGYGAGLAVLAVILVGTYSRGGWLVLGLAGVVWFLGVPRAARRDALVVAVWPVLSGVLLSRAFLGAFHRAEGAHGGTAPWALVVLLAAAALGGAGVVGYRHLRRAMRRRRWDARLERAVVVAGAGYVALALLALGWMARHDAARGGAGVLEARFVQRLGSIGLGAGSAQTRFSLWEDAWRLIRRRPVLGYGGGGWAARYHQVQSSGYWVSLVHGSLAQAWVDAGLLGVLGLAALGGLLLWRAWTRRGEPGAGPLLWGLGVAGFGLWAHALIDFDLSIPALALLLWTVAACLRSPAAGGSARSADSPTRPDSRRSVLAGLAVGGACALALLLYAQRFGYAHRLQAFAAAAMADHQYSEAYVVAAQANRLDPLSAANQADVAQLVAAAYTVNHAADERTRALAAAGAAMRLDPGNLNAQVAAVRVGLTLAAPRHVQAWSAELLRRFPLDTSAYQRAGAALLAAAEAEARAGYAGQARADLRTVVGLQARYAAQVRALARGTPPAVAALPAEARLAEGEAQVLLGHDNHAAALLGPLAQRGGAQASGWLAAAWGAMGDPAAVGRLLHPSRGAATAEAAYAQAEAQLRAGALAGGRG